MDCLRRSLFGDSLFLYDLWSKPSKVKITTTSFTGPCLLILWLPFRCPPYGSLMHFTTTSLFDYTPTLFSQSEQGTASGSSRFDLGIVRQFPFTSALQRASVIVKLYQSAPKELLVFLKGAPETVAKLCEPGSIPHDFHDVLKVM